MVVFQVWAAAAVCRFKKKGPAKGFQWFVNETAAYYLSMGRKRNSKKPTNKKRSNFLLWLLATSLLVSIGFSIYQFVEIQSLKKVKGSEFSPGKKVLSAMEDLAFFDNEELSCTRKNLRLEDLPLCPRGKGLFFLTRNYPPDTVFVGYLVGTGHHALLQEILRAALKMKPSPPVVVLVPQTQVQAVKKEIYAFLTPRYRNHVKFLIAPAEITTWVQDYFETVLDGETFQSALLDLPYYSQEGDALPGFVASVCGFKLLPQTEIYRTNVRYVSGDYGGNIEALSDKLVLVGNNLHEDHLKSLIGQSAQKLVTVDVRWLDVGHVDEVFSVIPGPKGGKGNCPSRILYASPAEGWRMLSKNEPLYKESEILLKWEGDGEDKSGFDLRSCFKKGPKDKVCQILFAANSEYEKIMQSNIQLIKEAFGNHDTCDKPVFSPVPVLFSPTNTVKVYGQREDEARPIDANPINNIILGTAAFVPRQSIPEFYRYTKSLFGDLRYQIRFVEGRFLHRQGGGIHCNMNVKRTCRESRKLEVGS